MMPLFKSIHNGQEFFVMNLVVNGENLRKWKPIGWKRLSSPGCETTTPNAKSKASIYKIKGLEGFA
jgi:hypothetical protein